MMPNRAVSLFSWTLQEEKANQLTHGLGFLLSLPAAAILVGSAHPDLLTFGGCLVYALSLIALFAASTLSHSFEHPGRRRFFRMLDQVCIFLLIAGGITPFILVHVREPRGWAILTCMWGIAIVGSLLRIRSGEKSLTTLLYLVMGWIPVLLVMDFYHVGHWSGLGLVVVGGLFYTIGTIFLTQDHRSPWFHPVWHLLVIGGTTCHYWFLLTYVAVGQPELALLSGR